MTARLTHRSTVRKRTLTKYRTFNSNHPTQHKISCIRSLFNRIDTHCNTEQAKQTEQKYLFSTFMKNNYPRNFISKILTKIRNKPQNNIPNEQPKQSRSRTRITLPYINNTSEMTARLLRPFNIDIAHKPTQKLRSYFKKHKDKTTTKQTKNVIHMIPCRDCPDDT